MLIIWQCSNARTDFVSGRCHFIVWRRLLSLLFIQRINWTASEDILYDPLLFVFDSSAVDSYGDFQTVQFLTHFPQAFTDPSHWLRYFAAYVVDVNVNSLRDSWIIRVWMIIIIRIKLDSYVLGHDSANSIVVLKSSLRNPCARLISRRSAFSISGTSSFASVSRRCTSVKIISCASIVVADIVRLATISIHF